MQILLIALAVLLPFAQQAAHVQRIKLQSLFPAIASLNLVEQSALMVGVSIKKSGYFNTKVTS
jgi:hypothetical protein